MTEIRRKRRRRKRRFQHEDFVPTIDPVAVRAWLNSLVARWTVPAICLFLVVALMLVYGQLLTHEFINLGDRMTVEENPVVTSGLKASSISHVFFHIDEEGCGFYAPITMISHMADWQLHNGFYDHWAGGHLLTNLLLHGATVLMLFLTLRVITGAIWRSAFVATLFAIHPLQVESVSWVSERNDVLCGFFLMLTVSAYVRYVYRPWSLLRYLTVVVLFVLGLLSKPALAGLPFVLMLLDYWPLSRYTQPVAANDAGPYWQRNPTVFLRLLGEKIPLFGISFVAYVLTLVAQRKIVNSLDVFSFAHKIHNALVSYVTYVGRTFHPVGLTVFYPQSADSKLFLEVFLALFILVVVTAAVFFLRKNRPYLLVGWFWYLGMLAPAIGWGEGGLYAGADRFVYLPQIGLYFMIAWGAWDLCALLPRRAWIAGTAMVVSTALMMKMAHIQCRYWYDGESLWNHALECTKDNYIAHNNLGIALVEKGSMDEGIASHEKALDLRPDYAEAHDDLGNALMQKGSLDEAIAHYQKALDIRPNFPEAYIDISTALVASGRLDDAIASYKKALEIRPDYAKANYNLGNVYIQKQDFPEAASQFKRALEIQPYYAEAHFNLGRVLSQTGDLQGAISQFQKALEIQPNYADAEYFLGITYFQNQDVDNAILHWNKAVALRPNYEEAHYNLGIALVQQGDFDGAIFQYNKALDIGPHYAETYNNLGTALLQKKQFKDARDSFEKSLEMNPGFLLAKNNLAWLLATCPVASLRDGNKAVDLILNESKQAGARDPALLQTLAAAYAEASRFPEAVDMAKQALQAFATMSPPPDTDDLRHELKLYESGTAYHEVP